MTDKPTKSPQNGASGRGRHLKTGKSKEEHTAALVEYLANPDNPYLTREGLAKQVCGITKPCLYHHFTTTDLSEIEGKALAIRRGRYARKLVKVDTSVLDEGAAGSFPHAKLAYERFEGWNPAHRVEMTGNVTLTAALNAISGSTGVIPADDKPVEGLIGEGKGEGETSDTG